jgi:hypothetical protein
LLETLIALSAADCPSNPRTDDVPTTYKQLTRLPASTHGFMSSIVLVVNIGGCVAMRERASLEKSIGTTTKPKEN